MSCCDQICEGLYLGNYEAACDRVLLDSLGITHILTVASDLPAMFPEEFCYLQITALDTDTENLFNVFSETTTFISNTIATGKVLVHCLMGISRSSTIIIAYLMSTQGLNFEEALHLTTSRHSETYPNQNFVRQLKKLDSMLVFYI